MLLVHDSLIENVCLLVVKLSNKTASIADGIPPPPPPGPRPGYLDQQELRDVKKQLEAVQAYLAAEEARKQWEIEGRRRWISKLPASVNVQGPDEAGWFFVKANNKLITGKTEDFNGPVVQRLPAHCKDRNELVVAIQSNPEAVSSTKQDQWCSTMSLELMTQEFGAVKAVVKGLASSSKPGTRKSTVHTAFLLLDALGVHK